MFFFFNDTATTEIYTLSLHDALPICSHSLAALLQADGYKVGLYTSPHIIDFKERIRINGKCVEESFVIDFVENYRSFFEPLHPSFFELTTAMAFKYFADNQVDIAVIEVGLGGR